MSMPEIKYCPGTLAEGYDTYSATCRRILFDRKKVSHILPYDQPQQDEAVNEQFIENRKRISISGVQEKLSLILDKNILRLTNEGEQGTYILKPIPRDLRNVDQVPANEHLTMQIASQLYNINTAANAMIFFKNGTPAYITKRFDVKEDKTKWKVEDFASLAEKTKDTDGPDFKYGYSYEEIGSLIKRFVPAWKVEIEKFFSLVVFNFLFSNGDAHLKNFSLIETQEGDSILSPAYDLINTRLHVSDTDFALDKKLFKDDFQTPVWKKTGHPCAEDFVEFAKRIGLNENRIGKLLQPFTERQLMVDEFIKRSFLSEKSKRAYQLHYDTKRNNLNEAD